LSLDSAQPSLSTLNPKAVAVGIRGTAGAVGIFGAEGIVDAVRTEWTPSPKEIGRGIRIERIRTQMVEIFRVDGERQWQQQE
jgi:hypothetical protein